MERHQRRNPTRLVNISGSSAKLEYPPAASRKPYVALSHCWGNTQPLTTTKQNLQDHIRDIPLSALPPTFRDAITIVRELNLAYIWIDSLCIVQDDPNDWEREAANMANIYESAELTIAAAWGSDSKTRCFHDYFKPLLIEVSGGTDYKRRRNQTCVRLAIRPRLDDSFFLNKAPLNTRKWVLQEQLLSPRTLTFAEDQMHWTCPSLTDSEDGLGHTEFSSENSNYTSLHYWESGVGQDIDSYIQLHESWQLVVGDHSSRKLTFTRDKLATLAGITQAYKRIFGDEPLVGLWRGDLARTILWETEAAIHSQLDHEAIKVLNIPSWSWLKINGTVRAASQYGNGPLLTIKNAELTWTGLQMTSKIAEARIVGHGKMFRILNVSQPPDETCMCYAKLLRLEAASGATEELEVYTWFLDECVKKLPDNLSCLPAYDTRVATRWTLPDDPLMEVRCLILGRPANAKSAVEYVRLGVIDIKEFPRVLYDTAEDRNFILV
jgi:hypothetical protein